MRRFLFTLVPVLAGMLLVGSLGAGCQPAAPQPKAAPAAITWNLPTITGGEHYIYKNLEAFAAQVKERTKGGLEIRVHPSSSLYDLFEIPKAVMDGRAEIGGFLPLAISDAIPAWNVLELPFLVSSEKEGREGVEALRKFWTEEGAQKGIMPLAIYAWPSQHVFSVKKPIAKVSDWKDLKIRTYGVETAELAKAMEAAPVTVPSGELYVALQRGVADATMTSTTFARQTKIFEVVKYSNRWNFVGAPIEFLAVNKKAWEALSEDIRKVVQEEAKKTEDKLWQDAFKADKEGLAFLEKQGLTTVPTTPEEVTKEAEKSRVVWDNWLKRAGPKGEQALKIAREALKK